MIETTELKVARRPGEPKWLSEARREAHARFASLGFPTMHDEEWKYTSVSAIARTSFEPPPHAESVQPSQLLELGCQTRLVFVNGRFSKTLSNGASPQGVSAGSLARMLTSGDTSLEAHLVRYAKFDRQAFVALNTAMFEDGAAVIIGRDVSLDSPIQVIYLSTRGEAPWACRPRTLILAGKGSRASVIEVYLGPDDAAYFTNAVTEISLAEGAILDHYKLQSEGKQAFHIATVQAVQDRNSLMNSHNVSLGAGLARNDINSVLDGSGAECSLDGLFTVAGRQHVDNHTMLDHASPNCTSRELYKGILAGRSAGVFNGKIVVRKDAQKTNAFQANRNLLLSGEAVIDTKPQLEIFADDVRCTHGATVGQLDRDAVFYMQTRGIPAAEARRLLTRAFAGEILDRIDWRPLREHLEREVEGILAAAPQEGSR